MCYCLANNTLSGFMKVFQVQFLHLFFLFSVAESKGDGAVEADDSDDEDWTFYRNKGDDKEDSAMENEATDSSLMKMVRFHLFAMLTTLLMNSSRGVYLEEPCHFFLMKMIAEKGTMKMIATKPTFSINHNLNTGHETMFRCF